MARIKGAPSRKSLASVMMPGMALLAIALNRRDYGGVDSTDRRVSGYFLELTSGDQ